MAGGDIALIGSLNDLLQLEHDALPAYKLAIAGLRGSRHRAQLELFHDDHARHADELSRLVAEHGGLPLTFPHIPTGLFKLAVQAAGLPGGERAVLLAFRANEWQSAEKYRRAAASLCAPPATMAVLRRAAEDEARHYAWAVEVLEGMGLGADTPVGMANAAFAQVHGALAETIESAARIGLEVLARARPSA